MLDNTVVEVDDQTGVNQPILLQANVLQNSKVVVRNGNVLKQVSTGEGGR
jgi:hypothetical protein